MSDSAATDQTGDETEGVSVANHGVAAVTYPGRGASPSVSSSAATVEFEEQHAHNMHILGLIRDEPAWALARILRCEALEARRHYTRRMLQALDIYWFCAEGLPKGRYPRGRYTAEDWWNRYERYRALVEESIVV